MLRVIVVSHFEAAGLQLLRVPPILRVFERGTAGIRCANGGARPDTPRGSESELRQQTVHALSHLDGLTIGIVKDRERKPSAFRPRDHVRVRYSIIASTVPKFSMVRSA